LAFISVLIDSIHASSFTILALSSSYIISRLASNMDSALSRWAIRRSSLCSILLRSIFQYDKIIICYNLRPN
jgi:hypothetical protein